MDLMNLLSSSLLASTILPLLRKWCARVARNNESLPWCLVCGVIEWRKDPILGTWRVLWIPETGRGLTLCQDSVIPTLTELTLT